VVAFAFDVPIDEKIKASRTLKEPLPWQNSTLLTGDLVHALAESKKSQDRDLVIMGSGELIRSLMSDNLIDEYVLLIHPLVLRQGHRLFADGVPATPLELVRTKTTEKGVIAATYRPIH
jgi:dihydrofolate reductase